MLLNTIWDKLHKEIKRIIVTYYTKELREYSIRMDNKIIHKKGIIIHHEWSIEKSVEYHTSCICYTLDHYFDILGRVFLDELFLRWCIISYFNEEFDTITHEKFEQMYLLHKNNFMKDKKGDG